MNISVVFPGLTRIILPISRRGFESFINSWLIADSGTGKNILVECGPASAIPALGRNLAELGVRYIDYLLLTHIHLDHSGGAGHFHRLFPEAKMIAPAKGVPHLTDPAKLIEGSKNSLGDLYWSYGEPLPVPGRAFAAPNDYPAGLDVVDTPGHAPFHSSYICRAGGRKILFIGEAGGCCFECGDGSVFMRPATPHKFYYDTAVASLDKLMAIGGLNYVCYPHSGCFDAPYELMRMSMDQFKLWKDTLFGLPEGSGVDDAFAALAGRDPMFAVLRKLPEPERRRERFFIRQSIRGYLGYIGRIRA